MSGSTVAVADAAARIEFATFHEGYLSRYIQLADAKAGSVLVIVAAAIGYALGQDNVAAALHGDGHWCRTLLASTTILSLATSGALAFLVIAPRTPTPGNGLVFWEDVAELQQGDFVGRVRASGQDGLARERLAHSHALAGVCRDKYLWLRRAMPFGAVGLVGAFLCRVLL